MMRYIWQAAKVLLCETGELLAVIHDRGLGQTNGLFCESDEVEQLLHNTGPPNKGACVV